MVGALSMLLFGFALASVQPPGPDGAAVSAALESRVLFSLLLFSFSLLMEFALVRYLQPPPLLLTIPPALPKLLLALPSK